MKEQRFKSKKVGTVDVAKHTRPRTAPRADPLAEFKDEDGVINAVDHANSMRILRGGWGSPSRGPRSVAAAQASRPARQQTLDDFEFSLGSKQTMQGALNELSADEISDMLRAMDTGEGVDVRSGSNKMAFDIMRMKRGLEAGGSVDETGALLPQSAARSAAAKDLVRALTKGAKQYKTHRLRQGLTKDDDWEDFAL